MSTKKNTSAIDRAADPCFHFGTSDFGHCPHLDDPARLARLVTAFARAI